MAVIVAINRVLKTVTVQQASMRLKQ